MVHNALLYYECPSASIMELEKEQKKKLNETVEIWGLNYY